MVGHSEWILGCAYVLTKDSDIHISLLNFSPFKLPLHCALPFTLLIFSIGDCSEDKNRLDKNDEAWKTSRTQSFFCRILFLLGHLIQPL